MRRTSTKVNQNKSDWQQRAEELHEKGGVPERRAEIAALREQGRTYQEIVDATDINYTSNVSQHLDAYREQLEEARWLVENGPDGEEL